MTLLLTLVFNSLRVLLPQDCDGCGPFVLVLGEVELSSVEIGRE